MKAPVRVSDPLLLVTVTSTAPAPWAGESQVMVVVLTTARFATGVPPKVTVVFPVLVKFDPVRVQGVPPATPPSSGSMAESAGGAL